MLTAVGMTLILAKAGCARAVSPGRETFGAIWVAAIARSSIVRDVNGGDDRAGQVWLEQV